MSRTTKAALLILAAISLMVLIARDLAVRHRYGVTSPQYRALKREPDAHR